MSKGKYSTFLTIILIIAIVVIVGLVGFGAYKLIKGNDEKILATQKIEEFNNNIDENSKKKDNEEEEDVKIEVIEEENTGGGSGGGNSVVKKTYYNGFIMVGYITIPKTSLQIPILEKETPEALETSVAIRYKNNAGLNEPGNVVIAGHNYRNGKFFSNNKKLSVGDIIKIKDESGTELTYTIYSVFEAAVEDTSFYNRDTNGAIEVTLTTCTDDSSARTIICARVE